MHVCEKCGLSYTNKSNLNRHRRNVHFTTPPKDNSEENNRPFKCSYCPLRFYKQELLKAHESGFHSNKEDANDGIRSYWKRRKEMDEHQPSTSKQGRLGGQNEAGVEYGQESHHTYDVFA